MTTPFDAQKATAKKSRTCNTPNVTRKDLGPDPVLASLLGVDRLEELQNRIVVVGQYCREGAGFLDELDHPGILRGGNDGIGCDTQIERCTLEEAVHELDHHHDQLVLPEVVSRLHEDPVARELGNHWFGGGATSGWRLGGTRSLGGKW